MEQADREDRERFAQILVALEQIRGQLSAVGVKFWAVCAGVGFASTVAGGIAVGIAVWIVQRVVS